MTAPSTHAASESVRLGLRGNLGQFALLVVVSALVGAMVGLERSILPASAVLLGIGTAMVYPTLLAAIGDAAHPSWRGHGCGRRSEAAHVCQRHRGRF